MRSLYAAMFMSGTLTLFCEVMFRPSSRMLMKSNRVRVVGEPAVQDDVVRLFRVAHGSIQHRERERLHVDVDPDRGEICLKTCSLCAAGWVVCRV